MQTSDWIALSSAAVAVCAFITTLWQARESHLRSLISVKPVLEVHLEYNDLPNKEFELFIRFSNVGLGPAKITSWKYFLNDEEMIYDSSLNTNYTTQLFKKAFNSSITATTAMGKIKGNIIKVNYTETLLGVITSSEHQDYLLKRFADIRLIIEYTDLYGNAQPALDTKEIQDRIL